MKSKKAEYNVEWKMLKQLEAYALSKKVCYICLETNV